MKAKITKVRQEVKYLTIQELYQEKGYPLSFMCAVLEVARSAYYQWRNRKPPAKEQQDTELAQIIQEYHATFGRILGYRRMTLFINRLNQTHYNPKRIRRLMRIQGLKAEIRKPRKGHRKSTPQINAENILNRNFEAAAPNTKWLSDITEFRIKGTNQKLFLSVILDLYEKSIIAYEISRRNNNQLVFKTFDKAIEANPGAKPLFHSDRGSQYTSRIFQGKLQSIKAVQSMSRTGRCIDNGPMEGFFGALKAEMYHLNTFHSVEELKEAIDAYISFYNHQRFSLALKGLTPIEYRNQALQNP